MSGVVLALIASVVLRPLGSVESTLEDVPVRRSRVLKWSTGAVASCLLVAAATWLGRLLLEPGDLANVCIIYIFAVALVSMRFGYGPAILAAVASALSLDYFFEQPVLSFTIARNRDMVTFSGMLVVAVFISALNIRNRQQTQAARRSQRYTQALFDMERALARGPSLQQVTAAALASIEAQTGARAEVQWSDAIGSRAIESSAGVGEGNPGSAQALYLPLRGSRGHLGTLMLHAMRPGAAADRHLMLLVEAMAAQLSVAVDNLILAEERNAAQIEAEIERTRNVILSAVSHDLRGPLSTIISASSTLVEGGMCLPSSARLDMTGLINEEAKRVAEILRSLTDVTRLQSGALKINGDWESLEDVVANVLRRIETRLDCDLNVQVDNDLPLVRMDPVLIEQVILNLVDNAVKHGGRDAKIELAISTQDPGTVRIAVVDHGVGIPAKDVEAIFAKFYRGRGNETKGLGLGLTIARGIVEAHGGRIWAEATPGGGLTVVLTLPRDVAAPHLKEADFADGDLA